VVKVLVENWIKQNYMVGTLDVLGDCIVWGNGYIFYGIYTPIDKFIDMFGDAIQAALDTGRDVREAIREADPDNEKGFNDII
jgi:hypothetical protein